jgi:hypothetical protein
MIEPLRNHPTTTTEVANVTLTRRQLRRDRARQRRTRRHRMLGASAMVGALVTMGFVAFTGVPGQAAGSPSNQTPNLSLSVTPTQNLSDGQSMSLTVSRTAAAPTLEIQGVQTGWCLPNAVLPATATGSFTNGFPTFEGPVGALGALASECTDASHPLNSDLTSPSAISPPVNPSGDYPTVTGTVLAQVGTVSLHFGGTTLTCDFQDPCQLGVAVWTGTLLDPGPTYLLAVPVTFLPPQLSTSCGGTAPGMISSSSPDRLGQLVTDWTLGACATGVGGGKVLASNTSAGLSDQDSLCQFASGTADLAYSAVGYDATNAPDYGASSGFDPTQCSPSAPDRPYVAVPIALNAVVFDHTQTQTAISVNNQLIYSPYPQLDMTIAQAAQLLGGDYQWSSSLGQGLLAENPELSGDTFFSPDDDITNTGGVSGFAATAGTDATTLFATGFLNALDSTSLITPQGQPLGVNSNFGTTTTPYNVFTYSGTPQRIKDTAVANGHPFGLMDADSAAATWGGLADFAIQTPDSLKSGSPTFVAPDAASMDAAVAQMTTQSDGTLLPNPNTTGSTAYPLTFVEYAMAPTQPLLNQDCSPNTQSQQDLTDWLNYLTGPGQSVMPAGLAPLTPGLTTQAQAAIAQIGKAPVTGSCASTGTTTTTTTAPGGAGGSDTTTTTTTTPAAPAATSSGSGDSPTFSGFDDAPVSLPATSSNPSNPTPVATPGGSGGKSAKSGSQNGVRPNPAVQLNGLHASNGTGWLISVLGVLLLAVLIQGLAMLISGKSLRESLAGVGSWFSRKGSHRAGGGESP